MDADDDDSQLSLLEKTSPRGGTRLFHVNNKSMDNVGLDGSLQVQNDLIDDFVRGQEAEDMRRSSQSRSSRRRGGLWAYLNVGVVAVVFAVVVAAIGFSLRYSETHTSFNRFLIASGVYGLFTATANFLAIRVLLKTMFLSRNERLLQSSVRDIVMNLVFSRDTVDAELATQVRRAITTASLHRTVRRIVSSSAMQHIIDDRVGRIFRSSEGVILGLIGVSEAQLRSALTPEHIYDMLSRVVSVRVEALSVSDLQSIVSGVLLPQLSFIVLWGCIVGMILGAVTEAAQLSKIIGETPS